MEENEILESNKLIAEFMMRSYQFLEDLKYHSSWDWLMPVVDKIESLGYNVSINRLGIQIVEHHPERRFEATDLIIDDDFFKDYVGVVKKESLFNCLVSFIEWYNQKK